MEKSKVFEKELNYIKSPDIKEFTKNIVELLPDYFFEVPASSTGKYHPSYALGEGGLVRHTKAAVGIAKELFTINSFGDGEEDCIISALILHDGMKSGKEKSTYTAHEHPKLMSEFIACEKFSIPISLVDIIRSSIESHMGQWNTNKYSNVELPTPVSKIERFVHMCDYLASRKCLEFNFAV